MSTKLAIYVTGSILTRGHRQREFVWDAALGIYLYGGRLIDAEEFNVVYTRCVKTNSDMHPMVRVISTDGVAVAPVATIAAAREVTLEEAEAVVERLAPGRLKKKTGPKGAIRVMEVA